MMFQENGVEIVLLDVVYQPLQFMGIIFRTPCRSDIIFKAGKSFLDHKFFDFIKNDEMLR